MQFRKEFLKQRRKEKGMGLVELSKICGISKSHIHHLENKACEIKSVSASKLYKLAKALDIPMEAFFEEVEEEKTTTYYTSYFSRKGRGNYLYACSDHKITEKLMEEIENKLCKSMGLEAVVINFIIKLEE